MLGLKSSKKPIPRSLGCPVDAGDINPEFGRRSGVVVEHPEVDPEAFAI